MCKLLVPGVVAALALLPAHHAHACPVAPSESSHWETASSQAWADIVALATVASSTQTEPGAAQVELIVEHIWKGKIGARWTFTQALGPSCDYPLVSNVRYVIFAKRQDDGKVALTGVADGPVSIVRDKLTGKVKPPAAQVSAAPTAASSPRKKQR